MVEISMNQKKCNNLDLNIIVSDDHFYQLSNSINLTKITMKTRFISVLFYLMAVVGLGAIVLPINAQEVWISNSALSNRGITCMAHLDENTLIFGSNEGVYLHSEDGAVSQLHQSTNGSITSILVSRRGARLILLAGTQNGGVFRSVDNGNTWEPSNRGLGSYAMTRIMELPDGIVYAGTQSGGLYRSENRGESWLLCGLEGEIVTGVAYSAKGSILCSTYRGVFVSESGKGGWKETNSGLTNKVIESLLVTSNGTVVAGCYNVGPCAPGGMFRSIDNGETWKQVGFEHQHIKSLYEAEKGKLLAGTWCGGIFTSDDNALSWSAVNNGLRELCVQSLVVSSGGTMTVACYGSEQLRTVYQYRKRVEEPIAGEPIQPMIQKVYPNPITNSTTITYNVTEKSAVQITIVNAVGETVATLISSVHQPGVYTIKWNAENAESGSYGVRVVCDKRIETIPLVVLK
jgi:photosystem II stability/assembly factor-like uncharacterized protein